MAEASSLDDLTTLSELDETILLQALKTRYSQGKIYTYVGDILIAVNPFRELPIYGKDVCKQYMFNNKKQSRPPHIYALADLAYQSMLGRRGLLPANQCILISGESGAGKTESTKFLLRQLIELCNGNTQLEQQILQVTPLLEAFGNAQTMMNDNSSRFGKYIQLKFHKGQVLGAKISEYLLEKSRLVHQDEGEENFHVFYYMFAGETAESLNQLHLSTGKTYRYLGKGITLENIPRSKQKYAELINAFELVGFTDEEQANAFTILAGILHLGEVLFSPDQSEAATISQSGSAEAISIACALLGIDEVEVGKCLTSSVTVTRGDYVERKYTIQQSNDSRDAMAKAIYGRLFGWIVKKVNNLVAPQTAVPAEETQEIGILDIFGFEHFEHNSFEQACINLANEQIQLFFNQYVFKKEQEEYIKEGIDWTEVKFADNKHLLDLFLDKPIGILSLLDEECTFPTGSDKSFVEKLNSNFSRLSYYNKSKHTHILFNISHYAGKVTYDATSWLEKNRDTFPGGIMHTLLESKNKLIKLIFGAKITRTGTLAFQSTGKRSTKRRPARPTTSKHRVTVGGQFRNSLLNLMEKMTAASPIFVRCLKPNQQKAAHQFDSQYMLAQLLYTGMLETVKIRRNGFAVRASFDEFVQKYEMLVSAAGLSANAESCYRILASCGISGGYVGKSKVFMKIDHVEKLTDKMLQLDRSVIHIQRVYRGHNARKKVKILKEEANKRKQEVMEMCKSVEKLGQSMIDQQQKWCQADKDAAKEHKMRERKLLSPTLPPPPEPHFPPPEPHTPPPAPHLNIFSPPTTGHESLKGRSVSSRFSSGSSRIPQQKIFVQNPSIGSSVGSVGSMDDTDLMDLSDDSDSLSADEFVPVEDMYGSIPSWFKETQTQYLLEVTGEFPDWFHGMISRRQAESLLTKYGVGSFLVRVSQNKFSYCLSFRAEDRCRHYMIEQLHNEKFFIVGEDKAHSSLTSLIKFYQQNKISNWDGVLTVGCGQEPGHKDYEDLLDQRIISLILQKLKTRPSNIRQMSTEDDDDEYLVPQVRSALQRTSYLRLIESESESADDAPARLSSYQRTRGSTALSRILEKHEH